MINHVAIVTVHNRGHRLFPHVDVGAGCAVTDRIQFLTSVLISKSGLELKCTGPGPASNVCEEIFGF